MFLAVDKIRRTLVISSCAKNSRKRWCVFKYINIYTESKHFVNGFLFVSQLFHEETYTVYASFAAELLPLEIGSNYFFLQLELGARAINHAYHNYSPPNLHGKSSIFFIVYSFFFQMNDDILLYTAVFEMISWKYRSKIWSNTKKTNFISIPIITHLWTYLYENNFNSNYISIRATIQQNWSGNDIE